MLTLLDTAVLLVGIDIAGVSLAYPPVREKMSLQ